MMVSDGVTPWSSSCMGMASTSMPRPVRVCKTIIAPNLDVTMLASEHCELAMPRERSKLGQREVWWQKQTLSLVFESEFTHIGGIHPHSHIR